MSTRSEHPEKKSDTPVTNDEKQTYEPPRVESVKLDKDAAEALT